MLAVEEHHLAATCPLRPGQRQGVQAFVAQCLLLLGSVARGKDGEEVHRLPGVAEATEAAKTKPSTFRGPFVEGVQVVGGEEGRLKGEMGSIVVAILNRLQR